ncbi:precorrin-6A/cobalt-precorrin-6A reductase [Aureispira anguillae]|uniref:Precorrin-6A/cobalt-precorrin-6A reductase n=1 Tax=Aureispira anguillae TaxID=2864201 RepID=A0A916DSJ0_9BACT|nr:precorrin-6A/cobalt-precorrin-6A reductase [Aureispira anguillae]BDS11200.1 precorrin-6A/cobalt-precorrin-6A reductase [Aureispira anguillae]
MILIFGGTTEGRQVLDLMKQVKKPYHYSTKTAVEYQEDGLGIYRFGALDEQALSNYIQQHAIKWIINAAHPFATLLHNTIDKVSQQLAVPVYRLERVYEERQCNKLVHYTKDYATSLKLLFEQFAGKTLMALSGVQSIPKLEDYWKRHKTFFRILDRASSIELAAYHQFPASQLILGYPNKKNADEKAIYQDYQTGVILTKESGGSGFLATKIAVALELGLPIIIIKRPPMPPYFTEVNNLERLLEEIKKWA